MCQHATGRKSCRAECRLHSNVDEVHDASPAAADQQRKGGREIIRGQNPAALKITLLTIPTGTPQSGRTVYIQSRLLCTSSKIRGKPGDNVSAQTVRRL